MAEKVLVIGPSGLGKSYAIKFLNPEETVVICPENKSLPFQGSRKLYKTVMRKEENNNGKILPSILKSNFIPCAKMANYSSEGWKAKLDDPGILEILYTINAKRPEIKNVIIDTMTYALLESVMDQMHNDDWKKYKVFAAEFKDVMNAINEMRDNLMVIVTSHHDTNTKGESYESNFKQPGGKFVKDTIVPEGLFTVVLFSVKTDQGEYRFATQSDGKNTAKSPEGMFESTLIENNYQLVRDSIFKYYNE